MKLTHLQTGIVEPGKLYAIPEAPDNVMLDLTWRCNLRCEFCYNEEVSFARNNPEPNKTAELLKRLSEWGVREVLYLGGEPTLLPSFEDAVGVGSDLGLRQRVVTNGLLMTAALAEHLARHSVEVGVSLQASTASRHDAIAGRPGAFEAAWRAIDGLVEAGCFTWVQYTPTSIDPGGLTIVDASLDRDFPEGVSFLDVNRLLPYGRGADPTRDLVPREAQWWEVMKSIGRLRLTGRGVRVESVPHCWVTEKANRDGLASPLVEAILASIRPCWMGIAQIALDPDGRLKLCPGGPPLGPSIMDSDPTSLWQELPLLVERRKFKFLPPRCVDFQRAEMCDRFYNCAGGCRCAGGVAMGAADPLGPTSESQPSDKGAPSSNFGSGTGSGRADSHQSSRILTSSSFLADTHSRQT